MSESLKVEPVRKYKVPKYPSWQDEDPLNPSGKNYSRLGYYTAAFFGAVGLFSFTNAPETPKGDNPIKFSELGFPHTYASYGTGLPNRMEREKAISVIDDVFRTNGIFLKYDVPFSEGDVEFKVSGYDPEKKVGFVWLDESTADQSCFSSWRSIYSTKEMLPQDKKELSERIQKADEDEKWRVNYQFHEELQKRKGYYQVLALSKAYGNPVMTNAAKQYLVDHKPNDSEDYGKEILEEYDAKMLDIKEMETVTKADDYSIASFSKYSPLTSTHWGQEGGEAATVRRIEELVQDYIDWARSEGRF